MEFSNCLDSLPWNYQHKEIAHLNQWSWAMGLEPHTAASNTELNLDDIELIYTEFHKLIDQVVAKAFFCTLPQLDRIKHQNQKLIGKLMTLECAITGNMNTLDATAIVSIPRPSAGDMGQSPPISEPSLASRHHAPKRRRISQNKRQAQVESIVTPATEEIRSPCPSNLSCASGCHVHDFDDVGDSSKLAKKLFQVVSEEAKVQLAELSGRLRVTTSCPDEGQPQHVHRFSSLSQITNMSRFLQLVIELGVTIEGSIFGEQTSRIRKRIALAHFYRAYTLAQDNPRLFLSWCDDQQVHTSRAVPPKGGIKSIVQHRFADIMFFHTSDRDGTTVLTHTSDQNDDTKRRIAKIQMWRKSGKKWAQIIRRFGYGILLLLPPSLSDEDLRVAHDKVLTHILDQIENTKHAFEDTLTQANDLINTYFFSQDQDGTCISSDLTKWPNWDHLLTSVPVSNR